MKTRRSFETLESRLALYAGLSAYMTLSFVPDGTEVSSKESNLTDAFSDIGSEEQWQQAIQNGFNSWAIHTNADIGVVGDNGDPLGTMGRRQGDYRFGDIRIAAVPLDNSVYAISFPRDNVTLGTWAADIIFNSNADWFSIEDIEAVALHEAGHIFGLEHTENEDSVMHQHGRPELSELTAADIQAIQNLYGKRVPDPNEGVTGNDVWESASLLPIDVFANGLFVGYGDISAVGDVDLYRLDEFSSDDGLSIRVQSDGISLLEPVVNFFDADGELVYSAMAEGGIVSVENALVDFEEAVFLGIEAGETGFEVGRYSFAVTSDEQVFLDEEYAEFAAGELYGFDVTDLPEYVLDNDDSFFFGEDDFLHEEFANATQIDRQSNAEFFFYESFGSISDSADSDIYALAPVGFEFDDILGAPQEIPPFDPFLEPLLNEDRFPFDVGEPSEYPPLVMTVIVQALQSGTLLPDAIVYDEFGNQIETEVIINGNGELILQARDIDPFRQYFAEILPADADGEFAVGNYKVSVEIGRHGADLKEFVSGELSSSNPVQIETLYVGAPQLFHFLLEVEDNGVESLGEVVVDIYNATGEIVYSTAARSGQVRSTANPLLEPGTYRMRIELTDYDNTNVALAYSVKGLSVSNPLGVLPTDPGNNPDFRCDGVTESFCYPGGTTSEKPFFWDKFIKNYLQQQEDDGVPSPAKDSNVDWWEWYWQLLQDANASVAPQTTFDTYRVYEGKLTVAESKGVLRNDASIQSSHMIATVAKTPKNGTLNLSSDGSFTYVPDADFLGTDTFSYHAFDFVKNSEAVEVRIHVDQPGDSNGDHTVDFTDFLNLATNFLMRNAAWEDGDVSGNGVVDFEDFLILANNFAVPYRRET